MTLIGKTMTPKHLDDHGVPIDTRPITDSPLFDGVPSPRPPTTPPPPGVVRRDAALKAVAAAAPGAWMDAAHEAVVRLCCKGEPFGADDVWTALGDAQRPPEPRALGALFKALHKRKIITPTGWYRQSKLPQQHARPIPTWRGA